MTKTPRNSPCPCGSGLKYKKCCLASSGILSVESASKPEVIDYHMVSTDGKHWERRPGALAATIFTKDPEDIDDRIESVVKKLFAVAAAAKNDKATEKGFDCKHKLYACLYHLRALEEEIQKQVQRFKSNYIATAGVSHERENPVLIYETEAFLFQIKSSLDVLVQFAGTLIPSLSSLGGFNHKGNDVGGKVVYILSRNSLHNLSALVEKNRIEWIQQVVKWRDTVGHHSNLKSFHCFVERPYQGARVDIHYPTMPNGERVDDYCESVFEYLLHFYAEIGDYLGNVDPGRPKHSP